MSELNASIQDGLSIIRRRKKSSVTRFDPKTVRETESAELRTRALLKLNDKSTDSEPSVPEGPRIVGRGTSEELRKVLDAKRQQERTHMAKQQAYERDVAVRARAKVLGKHGALIEDLPEENIEPDEMEELPEAEPLPEKSTHEKTPDKDGTVLLPRNGANRLTSRSAILRAPGKEGSQAAESRRCDPAAKTVAGGRGTRFIFKFVGVLLLIFFALLGTRWATLGKAPTDLVTVEGQHDLVDDTLAALSDLQRYLGRNAPETEADSAPLMAESKPRVESVSYAKTESAAPKPTVSKPPVMPAPSRTPHRTASPPRTFANQEPLLGTAQDTFSQANAFYSKADPRVAEFETIQKNLRLAAPLFERCLDDCSQARKKGARGTGIDALEQSATVRLYDCNKRVVLKR